MIKANIQLHKRTNTTNGKKAHNESQFIKIGRVRLHSWINEKLPAVIKSARPMNWGRLRKIELVCVKPRS